MDEEISLPADRVIRMHGEYSCSFWSTDGLPIWPEDLPISLDLRRQLERWAEWYDDEEGRHDGPPPWEAHGGPIAAFNAEGRMLARALKEELGPTWTVIMSDVDAWRYPKDDREHRQLTLSAAP